MSAWTLNATVPTGSVTAAVGLAALAACSVLAQEGPEYATEETRRVIERMVNAHGGMERWRDAPSVSYDNIFFNPFAQGDPWWVSREVTDPGTRRAYQDWPLDGATLGYDGARTWTTDWKRPNNPRFMAHFFYYFVNLPWLTQDAGVRLGEPESRRLPDDETEYIAVRMEFTEPPTVGKTADDSFRLFIHPETFLLQAYEYTIGWGPMLDGMNVPQGEVFGPTLRVHDRFSTVDDLVIPATMRTISQDGSRVFGHHAILNPSFSRPFEEDRMTMPDEATVDTLGNVRRPPSTDAGR